MLKAAEAAFLKVAAELKTNGTPLPPSRELDEILAGSDAQLRTILTRTWPGSAPSNSW